MVALLCTTEPQDGALSIFLSSQQAVTCLWCISKESHCHEGQLSASSRNRECQFEQCEKIKFCQKLGKSAGKMFRMTKQAYGEEALGSSAVFKWHKYFAYGRDSLEEDENLFSQEQSHPNSLSKKLQC
jgi:hypothetical protein